MNLVEALSGLVIGFLGGGLGLGGGIIGIPVITEILLYDLALARSTCLINNVILSSSAGLRHRRHKVRLQGLGPLLVGSFIGMLAGFSANSVWPERVMWCLYAGFLSLILIVFATRKKGREDPPEGPLRTGRIVLTGVMASFFMGALGVGGGSLIVPFLNRWAGIALKRAIVLSTTSIIFSSLAAVPLGYAPGAGLLSLHMTPGLLIGGYIGSSAGQKLPDRWIRIIFSGILLLILGKVLLRIL